MDINHIEYIQVFNFNLWKVEKIFCGQASVFLLFSIERKYLVCKKIKYCLKKYH